MGDGVAAWDKRNAKSFFSFIYFHLNYQLKTQTRQPYWIPYIYINKHEHPMCTSHRFVELTDDGWTTPHLLLLQSDHFFLINRDVVILHRKYQIFQHGLALQTSCDRRSCQFWRMIRLEIRGFNTDKIKLGRRCCRQHAPHLSSYNTYHLVL